MMTVVFNVYQDNLENRAQTANVFKDIMIIMVKIYYAKNVDLSVKAGNNNNHNNNIISSSPSPLYVLLLLFKNYYS